MGNKKKFYAVWEGHRPGVYDNWTDCQLQIKNYPQAKYKSFLSRKEALEALNGNYWKYVGAKKQSQKRDLSAIPNGPILDSISVDAACSGNPGKMEYRGVYTANGQQIFKKGTFQKSTNNVGEFLALVHVLALCKQKGDTRPIYSDSRTAMSWVRNRKVKSTLKASKENQDSFDLIERALKWLHNNTYSNQVLKWETKVWGEIPADFGRK